MSENQKSKFLNKFFEIIKKLILKIKKLFSVTNLLGHEEILIDSDKNFVNTNSALKISAKKYYDMTEASFDKIQSHIFEKYNVICEKFSSDSESVESKIRLPLRFGIILIALFIIFGFGWMAFAKIEGAAVAPGEVAFASSKQNIQSLGGGIVKNVLVKDGDFVLKGQVLMTFQDTEIKAAYNSLRNQLYALKITEERLQAEKKNFENFQVSSEILDESKANKDLKEILDSQIRFFGANKEFFKTNMEIFDQQQFQLKDEIQGLRSQENSLKEQLRFNQEELSVAENLFKDGAISKTRLLALKSHNAQLFGALGNIQANIAKAIQKTSEIEIQRHGMRNNKLKEIEDALKNLSIEIANGKEKMVSTLEALDRSILKAPISGNINNLKFRKGGDVVPQGTIVMEIVPENDNLIIEAKLFTKDINQLLRAGFDLQNYNYQPINNLFNAKIQIPSYSGRRHNKLRGSVFYVGPDVIVDQRRGFSYYLIKIMISKKELEEASRHRMKIFPGMEAHAFILTEARTPLSYFISPMTSAFERAMLDS
jgi:HlyD family secretion protein